VLGLARRAIGPALALANAGSLARRNNASERLGDLGADHFARIASTAVASVVACGAKLILQQPFGALFPLFRRQPSPSPRLHYRSDLVEVVDVKKGIEPVIPCLADSYARQGSHLVCDRPLVVGARSQQFTTVRVNVAMLARNYLQPRVVSAGVVAPLGNVAIFVRNAVVIAELFLQVDAVSQLGLLALSSWVCRIEPTRVNQISDLEP
jgi:hypothetical protein